MNKKARGNKGIIILVGIVVVIFIVLGYLKLSQKNDTPMLESLRAEPTFLTPGNLNQNSATIIFEVNNPTLIDFSGKTEFLYDEDCLSTSSKYKEVFANSKSKQAFRQNVNIKEYYRNNLPDKCYQTQSIFIRLEDNNGTRIYDSKDVKISITRP